MLDEFRSTYITWDKATSRIYSPVTANASDENGRKLNIQVVNSGQVENLTGATLHLYWETKDKTQHGLDAFKASDISKGEFEIFYTTGMLSNVGELNATLVLVDTTGKVVSDWFKITVARGIDNDAIQSENSFTTLTQALIDISNLEQNYTPRLNDLTAQLQQTEQELNAQLAQKATKEDVANISSGTPLFADSVANMTDTTRVYVNTTDGMIYIYNSANLAFEVTTRQYQSTGIQNRSITAKKTNFFIIGKNLFNKATVTTGFAVDATTGLLVPNALFSASDYINLDPSTNYHRPGYSIAFYDGLNVFISGLNSGTSFTTPANCSYARVSVSNSMLNTYQLELGDVATTYESYFEPYIPENKVKHPLLSIPTEFINSTMLKKQSVTTEKVKDISIVEKHIVGVTTGNLYEIENVVDNVYISYLNGNEGTNAGYFATRHALIESDTQYTIKSAYHYAWYDENKVFISGVSNTETNKQVTVISPSNARYLRVSSTNDNRPNQVIIKGNSIPIIIPPYRKELPWLNVNEENLDPSFLGKISTNNIEAFLPSEICVAVGRTIEIYNSQVMPMNPQNYQFAWDCEIGKSMKRKFTVTGTNVLLGTYPLNLTIYTQNNEPVWSGSTTLRVVSNVLTAVRTVLPLGDSLTNNKPWLAEVETLSGNKIDFVGTRVGTGGILHEGRSGYTSGYYLTNRAYNYAPVETVHPFWNSTTSRFDWNYYKTSTGINPDEVMIFLGMNELGNVSTPSNVKKIVDYIRQDDPVIPIHIVFSQYKGDQNAIGNTVNTDGYTTFKGFYKLDEDLKVLRLMKGLYDLLSSYSNLYFMPVSLTHDSENNYGAVETPVNPRATETESIPTDSVHPQTQGYMQFADCMFSVLAAHQ